MPAPVNLIIQIFESAFQKLLPGNTPLCTVPFNSINVNSGAHDAVTEVRHSSRAIPIALVPVHPATCFKVLIQVAFAIKVVMNIFKPVANGWILEKDTVRPMNVCPGHWYRSVL